MSNPTASKRDQVLAYLREHPGASPAEVAAGIGCNESTAYRWCAVAQQAKKAPMSEPEQQQTEDDTLQPGEEPEGDVVVVDRSYLRTLEALRDQVLETQRLRRALDSR
jgi:hypothetical protein